METRCLSALKQFIRTTILENSRKDLQEFKRRPPSNKEKKLQDQLALAKTADQKKAAKAALGDLEAEERADRAAAGTEPDRSGPNKFLAKMAKNLQNEYALADAIKAYASEDNPINVIIGSLLFENVFDAEQSGGEGGKSDVDIYTVLADGSDGPVRGISIKMPSADYWASAESLLGRLVGPKVTALANEKSPETRIEKSGKNYIMKSGEKKINRLYFKLPPGIARQAVFGPPGKEVEAVIEYEFYKGRATWDPKKNLLTIGHDSMKVYQKLRDIPANSYPVGAIRNDKDRQVTDGEKIYPGLRLVVARRDFAMGGEDSVGIKIP